MCSEAEYQPFAEMHWKATRNLDVSIDMWLLLLLIQSSPQRFCLVWGTDSTLHLIRQGFKWWGGLGRGEKLILHSGQNLFLCSNGSCSVEAKAVFDASARPSADPSNGSQSNFILTLFLSKALCSWCWMHSTVLNRTECTVFVYALLEHLFKILHDLNTCSLRGEL